MVIACFVLSACSSTSSPTTSLKATALAWAHAFLTGTASQQYDLQGPECLSGAKPKLTPSNLAVAAADLRKERADIARRYGMSTATMQSKIVGVSVRNVSERTGEAEVRYSLPVAVTGNDNWVTYELVDGKWKVQDCHAPIGGSSESSSSPAPTTP